MVGYLLPKDVREIYQKLINEEKKQKASGINMFERIKLSYQILGFKKFKDFVQNQKQEVENNGGVPKNKVEAFLVSHPGINTVDDKVWALFEEANKICNALNQENRNWVRKVMLEYAIGSIGENSVIKAPFYFTQGHYINVGNNTFINRNFSVEDTATVDIGSNVLIAPNVAVTNANHGLLPAERKRLVSMPVKIEDDVWVGMNSVILPGVTIHKGSVVAAGSVVTRSVEENAVAMGNPCRIKRKLNMSDKIFEKYPEFQQLMKKFKDTHSESEKEACNGNVILLKTNPKGKNKNLNSKDNDINIAI